MERHLSIEEVAVRIEVGVKFLQALENEMYPDISIGVFFYLAKVFKMEVSDLIEGIHEVNIELLDRNWRYGRNRF